MIGVGYDFVISQDRDVSSCITYSSGRPGDQSYDAMTLAVCLGYKIRRQSTTEVCSQQWPAPDRRFPSAGKGRYRLKRAGP